MSLIDVLLPQTPPKVPESARRHMMDRDTHPLPQADGKQFGAKVYGLKQEGRRRRQEKLLDYMRKSGARQSANKWSRELGIFGKSACMTDLVSLMAQGFVGREYMGSNIGYHWFANDCMGNVA